MKMRSAQLGKSILEVEVTNISKHGFWLFISGREFFLPFGEFPWFRNVPVGKLLNVQLLHPHHLYWPELDVDLAVESIEHPERFPLVSRGRSNKAMQPTRSAAEPPRVPS